jgi:hypothetical protein
MNCHHFLPYGRQSVTPVAPRPSRSRLGRATQFMQASALPAPGGGFQRPDRVVGVEFQAGQDVDPAVDSFVVPVDSLRHIPEPRRAVGAPCQEHLAIGAEGHVNDRAFMHQRWPDRPAGGGVPETRGPIGAPFSSCKTSLRFPPTHATTARPGSACWPIQLTKHVTPYWTWLGGYYRVIRVSSGYTTRRGW